MQDLNMTPLVQALYDINIKSFNIDKSWYQYIYEHRQKFKPVYHNGKYCCIINVLCIMDKFTVYPTPAITFAGPEYYLCMITKGIDSTCSSSFCMGLVCCIRGELWAHGPFGCFIRVHILPALRIRKHILLYWLFLQTQLNKYYYSILTPDYFNWHFHYPSLL